MKTREKFKRAVVEAIHGLPYEEALKKERPNIEIIEGRHTRSDNFPITIGRVMQALGVKWVCSFLQLNKHELGDFMEEEIIGEDGGWYIMIDGFFINWKLTKENGQECVDNDQSDETISALLKLLK